MNTSLHIVLLQSNLVWENPSENRRIFTKKIFEITEKVDLIVLPEMFTTGFSMHVKKLAETMSGETVLWMQKIAKEKNSAITGSLIIAENQKYYNRLLFVDPKGKIEIYDKKHTFSLAGEGKEFSKGSKKLIVNYKGWRICPLICYDLRFPVWARNTEDYDVLLYVANWPKERINAWDYLLKARAIENMSYCIGVNRVGVDHNDNQYTGHSIAIDYLGKEMTATCQNEEKTIYAVFNKELLSETKNKLGFLNDKDVFSI